MSSNLSLRLRMSVFVTILVAAFPMPTCWGCQDPASASVDTTLSSSNELAIFDATLGNLKAIRKWDCLIRVKEGLDSINGSDGFDENGVLVERYGLFRIAIDLDKNLYGCYRINHQTILDLSVYEDGVGNRTTQKSYAGICLDGVEAGSRLHSVSFPGARLALAWKDSQRKGKAEITQALGIPNFLGIGVFNEMPSSMSAIEGTISRIKAGWPVEKVRTTGDGQLEIRYTNTDQKPKGIIIAQTTVFDLYSSMPVGFSNEIYFAEKDESGKPGNGSWSKMAKGTVKWIELNKIFVASHLEAERNVAESVNGKSHTGELCTEIDIHWFSVNEDLPSHLFDGSCLSSLDEMTKLVDPSICGAEKLIERNPALKKKLESSNGNVNE